MTMGCERLRPAIGPSRTIGDAWRRARTPMLFGLLALATACSGGSGGGGGGDQDLLLLAVQEWNQIAIDASGLDHAPPNVGPPHQQHQLGPGRASRAMAIVHVAMFEAVIASVGGFQSYVGLPAAPGAETRAGVAQAAHDTLVALFPSQASIFDAALADSLAEIPNGAAKTAGIDVGQDAAQAILQMRTGDGSELPEPMLGVSYFTSDQPGRWRQDPISQLPVALGANWSMVDPFVMTSASQFRTPVPPALSSGAYTVAYDEVKALGGDGVITPTVRNESGTFIGLYWAYDGTPSLCAPPRLYNQIAVHIAGQMGSDGVELARLLAIMNVALADAGIGCWESKYFYDYWRPVTGIRESDPGTGPTGLGDGNPATVGDATYTPLCAPASNTTGVNFTPPFPAYPSGHATFGGALFQTLRRMYGTDDIPFTFVSDEYNGVTVDNLGQVRPLQPRTFDSLSEAEEENGQSRIYLGIHWTFDKSEGITMGRSIGNLVFDTIYTPN